MSKFFRDGQEYYSDYAGLAGYEDMFNKRIQVLGGARADSPENRAKTIQQIDNSINQFRTLFSNSVGRAPTVDEIGKYVSENAATSVFGSAYTHKNEETSGVDVRNAIQQYIADSFQGAANDVAQTKLSDLSTQAGKLSDQYLQMGKRSLGSLADDLKSYQVSLFDKLRPQLNLAAQTGGYGDSGGQTLQEQGALKDLANQATGIMAPLQYEVANNADTIRFGGASAPYQLASSTAAGMPARLADLGGGALKMNYSQLLNQLNNDAAMNRLVFQGGVASNLQNNGFKFGNNFGQSAGQVAGQYAGSMMPSPRGFNEAMDSSANLIGSIW